MVEIKFNVTEEQVQEAVKAIVREEMDGIADSGDYYGIQEMVNEKIKDVVSKMVEAEVSDRFDEIAKEEVEKHLSEPFTVDDGWGYNRTTYASYSDFIRAKLHEKFKKDDYSVKREFEKRVQEKVDKAWKEYRDDAIATVMAKVDALKSAE